MVVTKQSAIQFQASKRLQGENLWPTKERTKYCLTKFELFSDEMIDDDAALVRTSPPAETDPFLQQRSRPGSEL